MIEWSEQLVMVFVKQKIQHMCMLAVVIVEISGELVIYYVNGA